MSLFGYHSLFNMLGGAHHLLIFHRAQPGMEIPYPVRIYLGGLTSASATNGLHHGRAPFILVIHSSVQFSRTLEKLCLSVALYYQPW
jgi:hypothetical protein